MCRALQALVLCCGVFFVSGSVAAQDRVWTQTGETVPGFEAVDDAVRAFMQNSNIPGGVLAVTYQGRLVFAHGYTWDSPGVEPIRPTSLFRIASMSKPITSVAIHQLIERGLLSHDTLVAEALDLEAAPGESPDPWLASVTVDDLLYHTGGWDRDIAFDPMFFDTGIAAALDVDRPISKYDVATYMTGQEMQFEPGSRFAYSNYGYALLGMLIEKITGRDYSEWVAENVFQPIGVGRPRRGHTRSAEAAPTEANYYGALGQNPYHWNIENMDAHGGWILSAPDYLRLMSALFDDTGNSPLLSRQSIDTMLEVAPVSAAASYARGWGVVEDGGLLSIGHNGSLPGTTTSAQWSTNGVGVVALLNTSRTIGDLQLDEPTTIPDHDLFETVGITGAALDAALAESWVAVVANGGGAAGSSWSSNVGLLNRATLSNKVRLRIQQGAEETDLDLDLDPGEHFIVEDVVTALGVSGTGSLRVFSSEPLTITSRTFNTSDEGTFGQYLGGVTGAGGLKNGESAVLMHLRENEDARSNIGILNAGRRTARVRVELFAGNGEKLTEFFQSVDRRQVVQLNRPFSDQAGRTDIRAGYAIVTVLDGEEVATYASVIDGRTNDPTTIPMKKGSGATTLSVAAAAHADGVAGSLWRTDLGLLNISATTTEITVIFRRSNGGELSMTQDLAPGNHIVVEDIVGELGGEGSGSFHITSQGPILVSSRTYNESDEGTFGQFLDGLETDSMASAGDRVWLPQLEQSPGFRTNVGLLNAGAVSARVLLKLYDRNGELLSTSEHVVDASGRLQLQEPFDRLADRTDITGGYAVIEVSAGSAVVAYASVIDNRTNDPTTIPMVR